jgi:hypothetical protein
LRRRVSPVVNKAACKEAKMNRLGGKKEEELEGGSLTPNYRSVGF